MATEENESGMLEIEGSLLRRLAREATTKHSDPKLARVYMRERIDHDAQLRASILDNLIDVAVGEQVYRMRREKLATVKQNACSRDLSVIAAASGMYKAMLIDQWTMPDGRPLGDWTGAELLPEAEAQFNNAKGLQQKGEFYNTLASSAGQEPVRKALDAEVVEALWRKISGAGAHSTFGNQRRSVARPASTNANGQPVNAPRTAAAARDELAPVPLAAAAP